MIIRTYACDECGDTFEVTLDNGNAPDPECPYCRDVVLQWRPGMFAIGTNKGRAIDIAQDIVEKDYGLTNMKDNNREGDVAAMMPVPSTRDRDTAMQVQSEIAQQTGVVMTEQQKQQAASFWAGGGGNVTLPPAAALSAAKIGTAEANKAGVNPMDLLHRAGKSGNLPVGFRPIARG